MPKYQQVLVAPLGEQPHLVTFTLDLLLQAGYPIHHVIALHPGVTSRPRLQVALARLCTELTNGYDQEAQQPLSFTSHMLEHDGHPLDDIVADEHTDDALLSIQRVLNEVKRQGDHIHLLVSGGHPMIALLALSTAMLTFDRHDHIWYLCTPEHVQEEVRDGAVMHVPPESGVHLIQGPFLMLGAYFPTQSFWSPQHEREAAQEHARCEEVVRRATPAQRKVLEAFAEGLGPQQVAAKLDIALVTVHTHKTMLLQYCRRAWNMPDGQLSYLFLRLKFADYFGYPSF